MRRYVAVLLALVLAVPCLAATVVLIKKPVGFTCTAYPNITFYWRAEAGTITEGQNLDHQTATSTYGSQTGASFNGTTKKNGSYSAAIDTTANARHSWTINTTNLNIDSGRVGFWFYNAATTNANDGKYIFHVGVAAQGTQYDYIRATISVGGSPNYQVTGITMTWRVYDSPVSYAATGFTLNANTWGYVELYWNNVAGASNDTLGACINGSCASSTTLSRAAAYYESPDTIYFPTPTMTAGNAIYWDDFAVSNTYTDNLYSTISGWTTGYCPP